MAQHSQLKRLTVLFSALSQTLRGIFVGQRSSSYFSALGSEKGGEAEPTQKATLFPSGSVLHPTMNGVLKNITLGTRLFFIPHNWAICPKDSHSLLVMSTNETTVPLAVLVLKSTPPNWTSVWTLWSGLLFKMDLHEKQFWVMWLLVRVLIAIMTEVERGKFSLLGRK